MGLTPDEIAKWGLCIALVGLVLSMLPMLKSLVARIVAVVAVSVVVCAVAYFTRQTVEHWQMSYPATKGNWDATWEIPSKGTHRFPVTQKNIGGDETTRDTTVEVTTLKADEYAVVYFRNDEHDRCAGVVDTHDDGKIMGKLKCNNPKDEFDLTLSRLSNLGHSNR
jgi:hypothetical protein